MSTIIDVQNVSKYYPLKRYRRSLRHEALSMLRGTSGERVQEEGIWALRDVSFRVERGERVGIIGQNGSGKTTLLRVLSQITEPSMGSVQVKGRSASLIGVSAGFDFERTGRENIFLNAAMFGVMPKAAQRLMDEIIEFSELSRFIDTPIKLYSSGMVARLGFSIAVHVLPDIIFIDEVLSVGDTAFQEKSRAKLRTLQDEQRTFLIVSHGIDSIATMCERALWLHEGCLMKDAPVSEVVSAYRKHAKRLE